MEWFTTETDKTSFKIIYTRSFRRLRQAASRSTLSPPDLSEPFMKGLTCGIKMGDREKWKSRTSKFTNFEDLLCILLCYLMCITQEYRWCVIYSVLLKFKISINFKKSRAELLLYFVHSPTLYVTLCVLFLLSYSVLSSSRPQIRHRPACPSVVPGPYTTWHTRSVEVWIRCHIFRLQLEQFRFNVRFRYRPWTQ